MSRKTFRTYHLQLVVFVSFLALFSSIVIGIVLYDYRSNTEIVLKTSDELLYQISETVIRQTINHLEPAKKTGIMLRRMMERGGVLARNPDMVEALTQEALEIYPQFSAVYMGDENGNFVMSRRSDNGALSTKIVSRSTYPKGILEFERNLYGEVIATKTSAILDYDPRDRPWYQLAKKEGGSVWSREYRLFTDQVPGITCAHPVYDFENKLIGVVGVDFRLGELSEFLKSLKIGESGVAFIVDAQMNLLAYPESANLFSEGMKAPRSPSAQSFKSGWVQAALDEYSRKRETRFTFNHSSENYIAAFRSFPERFGRDWLLGIIVPEDDFIGPMVRTHETTLLFSFWLLIIGGFLTSALAKELAEPIKKLTLETEKIRNLEFDESIGLRSPITEIQLMANAMDSMKKALSAFKKYVPSEIVFRVFKSEDETGLKPQYEEITLMFTDIDNFTSIAESVSPEELTEQLATYFDTIGAIIHRYEGTIDKYIGDSVMAFWGAPVPDPDQIRHACRAAIEIICAIDKLNARWKEEGKLPFPTRIGINTGHSLIGNFGSSDRINYTAVGDNVNLASRLESLNKQYGTRIIFSEGAYSEGLKEEFLFRSLDVVTVKGREKSSKIYHLIGKNEDQGATATKNWVKQFNSAFEDYIAGNWSEAKQAFIAISEEHPEDVAAKIYIERINGIEKNPPEKWDGVFKFNQK